MALRKKVRLSHAFENIPNKNNNLRMARRSIERREKWIE
jgi:hypothetical protein